jgi:hypothetical protein
MKKKREEDENWGWITIGLGVVEPPPCPRGWSGHLQKAQKILYKKKKKKRKMS